MKMQGSLIIPLISLAFGGLLAYLSFSMQKLATHFASKAHTSKKRYLIFIFAYIARFIIYSIILVLAFLYFSLHPVFVIIGFSATILILIWRFHSAQKQVSGNKGDRNA